MDVRLPAALVHGHWVRNLPASLPPPAWPWGLCSQLHLTWSLAGQPTEVVRLGEGLKFFHASRITSYDEKEAGWGLESMMGISCCEPSGSLVFL